MKQLIALLLCLGTAAAETVSISVDRTTAAYLGPKNIATFKAANGIGSATFPNQATHAGEFLTTNGTVTSWAATLPSMTLHSGHVLTNNGSAASWAAVSTLLGTNLQAFDALTGSANKLPYFSGASTFALTNLTAFGRSLIDDVDAAAGRATLGAAGIDDANQFTSPSNNFLHGLNVTTSGVGGDVFGISGSGDISLINTGSLGGTSFSSIALGSGAGGISIQTTGDFALSAGGALTIASPVISGGSTIEDDFDVSGASFLGTMQLNDALNVGGLATFNHEATFFASAAGNIPMQVTAHAGQTAVVARWNDNGDADAISIDKDINLQMGGNNIVGAGSVGATTFTGALTGNVTGNVTGNLTGAVNGNTFTTGTGTLTIGAGKTLTASNTIILTATDGSTLAIGAGGTLGTAAYTAATAYQPADTDLTTWAGVTPTAAIATWLATPSSANLRAALTDESGSGAALFANGALGTPASGTVTNLTGTASININGTVGATTANTGSFTTLTASGTITANTSGQVINLSPSGGGTVTISPTGGFTVNPGGSAVVAITSGATGTVNNISVGATTRSSGAFTTLAANGAATLTAGTASTNSTTGTLVVTGGIGASGNISAGAPVRLKGYTVAGLPAGTQGDFAFVTDAVAPVFLGALTGGGSTVTLVFYNGTAWVAN